MRPTHSTIFLDVDDVIVLSRPAAFDKRAMSSGTFTPSACQQLLHPPAIQTLEVLVADYGARLVITSNWLRFMPLSAFRGMFSLAGHEQLAAAMHGAWCAPKADGIGRLQVIDGWLGRHHRGEPYCIVDDELSGSALRDSAHDRAGRVVLCSAGEGLHQGHLPRLRNALATAPSFNSTASDRPKRVKFGLLKGRVDVPAGFDDPLEMVAQERLAQSADPFAAEAAARAFAQVHIPPIVLALDLEATLISTAISQFPRPGLRGFLERCRELFPRLVMFTSVAEPRFREIARTLVTEDAAPAWFQDLEYVQWHGATKDLSFIPGCVTREVLLLDDCASYVHPGQQEQWVKIEPFEPPFDSSDTGLSRALTDLEARAEPWRTRGAT